MRSRKLIAALCLAALALPCVIGLYSTSARAATSPYLVVHADTQQPVADGLIRLDAATDVAATISQKNKTFEPSVIEVRAGQSIAIINDDNTVHNAFCSSGTFKYNAGPQQPGANAKITFTAAGSYQVRCAIHPKMLLTVKVLE